jgi:hypothetical protein
VWKCLVEDPRVASSKLATSIREINTIGAIYVKITNPMFSHHIQSQSQVPDAIKFQLTSITTHTIMDGERKRQRQQPKRREKI